MTRPWVPDPSWTGEWSMPSVLMRPVTEQERAVLVSLSLEGYGPKRVAAQLAGADTIGELLNRHPSTLRKTLDDVGALGIRAVVPSDPEYPDELGEIDAPPLLLFVRGRPMHEMRPLVAIVGARACTSGAARFAERLGEAFATAGYTIVSGLARGIDAAAHRGALQGGSTVAVIGTGLDVCYPPEHRGLFERIVANGAVVSEFPPGIGPRAWHFPARNRIIAGLACATIVVEAGRKSGALITAGFALDFGRHVLACTTGPENPAGQGVRDMLLDGAQLVVDAEQAVHAVTDLIGGQDFAFGTPRIAMTDVASTLAGELRDVYLAVTEDTTTAQVATTSGLDPSRVSAALAELEMDGVIEFAAGRWRRRS